jgi:hypothetical protein
VNFPLFHFEALSPLFKNPVHYVTLLRARSRLGNMLVGYSDTHVGRTGSIGVADLAVMWADDVKHEVAHHERHEGII